MAKSIRSFSLVNFLILKCQKFLQNFNIAITSAQNLARLQETALDKSKFSLLFIRAMGKNHYQHMIALLDESRAQLHQDLLVLAHTNYKQKGYFVEFGATNGILLSNTFLLEQKYSWKGILAEPGRIWESNLRINRPNAKISTKIVWSHSDQIINFNENYDPVLSTISHLQTKKSQGLRYKINKTYKVRTISLMDLLIEDNVPEFIDYLSLDTEGSEFSILQGFDFSKFSFGIITVEHNYNNDRDKIFALLSSAGYLRRSTDLSKWDDWYFNPRLLPTA